jgi:hypothetical protein
MLIFQTPPPPSRRARHPRQPRVFHLDDIRVSWPSESRRRRSSSSTFSKLLANLQFWIEIKWTFQFCQTACYSVQQMKLKVRLVYDRFCYARLCITSWSLAGSLLGIFIVSYFFLSFFSCGLKYLLFNSGHLYRRR